MAGPSGLSTFPNSKPLQADFLVPSHSQGPPPEEQYDGEPRKLEGLVGLWVLSVRQRATKNEEKGGRMEGREGRAAIAGRHQATKDTARKRKSRGKEGRKERE